MKSLLLIGAMAAGAATVSAPETAKADHCYPGSYGYRTGVYAPRAYGYGVYSSPRYYGGRGFVGRGYGFGPRVGYGYRGFGRRYGRGYGGFGIGIRTRNFGFGFYR